MKRSIQKNQNQADKRKSRRRDSRQSPQERTKDIELLSEIGLEITGSMDFDTIFNKLYENVNRLVDATIFGVGIFNAEKQTIEYRLAIEEGKRYAPYARDARDKNQFPVWCLENRKPIFINDVENEYSKYLDQYTPTGKLRTLEDGTASKDPVSLIYLPLIAKDRTLGVLSVQSFRKNAYSEYDLNILKSLAAYTTIALDNAATHAQLSETLNNLESIVEQRTKEISQQAREITTQKDKIQKAYEGVDLLSKIGQDITASLDSDTIFYKLYENVNRLLDATIFGVGIYHPDQQQIEYRLAIEKGKRYKPYTRDTKDKNQLPVWCIENRKPVFINDLHREYSLYIKKIQTDTEKSALLEDGSTVEEPVSLIYLPLIANDQVVGVITIQSFERNAYSEYDLNILQNLAAYTTIALDNSNAYRKLNTTLANLEKTVEERTREIRQQAEEISEQKDKIQKAYENIELLSEIGKEITASLDFETILDKLYEHVNQLTDATIFGVGIYHEKKSLIEYRLAVEKGKRYKPYTRDATDKGQFPVWCIENRKPVFINDINTEHKKYLPEYKDTDSGRTLEDGTVSDIPQSLIYLPLIVQDRVLGVITVQSYERNAYTDYHLNILQNLAAYTAIALDNAATYRQLDATLTDLKSTQQQLVTQEKLASLGALTAGIAHEIKNPLNFVNNFAELSVELIDEMREEIHQEKDKFKPESLENLTALLEDLEQNAKKINEHGKRADSIVKSMLQHSRGKAGERQETDINAMLEEDLNLAYHGMRAQESGFNVTIEKNFDETVGKLFVVPQDVSRVFLNVITNGFYEVHKKRSRNGEDFSPKLSISSKNLGNTIEIRIKDNGDGIPKHIQDRLFNPFFTTKPAGKGTGLGLSISYDIIVQEHKGKIGFDTKEGQYTEFIISLPGNDSN